MLAMGSTPQLLYKVGALARANLGSRRAVSESIKKIELYTYKQGSTFYLIVDSDTEMWPQFLYTI
jgi:hypothetical protein